MSDTQAKLGERVGSASNPMFIDIGSMAGSLISSGGGDQNNAQGVATAISQAPDLFEAIENFDASSFKAGFGSSMNIAGIAGNVLGAFADDRESLSGEYGQLSKKAEKVTDTVLSSIPGFGQAYTAINGVSDFLAGKYDNLSTSGNSKSDAIMDAIPLLGLANAAAGKEMNELDFDKKAWETVGNSYAGSQKSVKDAADNTGGRYGWLSTITGEYQKDLYQNMEADRQQTLVSRISDEATENSQIASSTIQEATMNQQKKLQGQGFTFRVQKGMKLPTKEDIQKTKKLFEEPKIGIPPFTPDYSCLFKDGGKTEKKEKKPKTEEFTFESWYNSIPEEARTNNYDYKMAFNVLEPELLKAHAQNPSENHLPSVAGKVDQWGRMPFLKLGNMEINPEVKLEFSEFYNTNSGFREKYVPVFFDNENRYYYVPRQKFKEGGKMNIIPEGELHARLHHMEQEGITKKGIPVISIEEGGEVVQHAEIERNEIIFHLELTQKLEELMKDGSDEAAIEAGKLLVDEILNNTEDRTGLLNEVE